jgi:hypothetical protein
MASLKQGIDPQIADLRKGLIEAQTDAIRDRLQTAQEKRTAAAEKVKFLAERTAARADNLLKEVDDAIKLVGATTTGIIGAGARNVPGTDAYRLNRIIDTLKANIGFQELQDMRQSSPTGGALGQIAVKELDMLQSVLGSLDTAQDSKTVKANLNKIKTHYERIRDDMRGKLGEVSHTGPATGIPAGSTLPVLPASTPTATPSWTPTTGGSGGGRFIGFEPAPGGR